MSMSNYMLAIAGAVIIKSCGTTTTTSCTNCGTSNDNNPGIANAVTLDNTGIVPVLGNGTTTSVFYVWNNSNIAINGIAYSAQDNNSSGTLTESASSSSSILDTTSASKCASIPAHSSCPITFTTPLLTGAASQGSALISASYLVNGVMTTFSNVLSYAKNYNNPESGALFNSGVQVNGFGHEAGHSTLYLYGSGQGQVYTIKSISSDKPVVLINEGDITGQQLQSGYVQAIEIASQTGVGAAGHSIKEDDTGFTATLTVVSKAANNETNYTNSTNIGVSPRVNGATLNTGLIPLIDSNVAAPSAMFYLSNAGSESATNITTSASAGITITTDNCSGKTLPAGGSCGIAFSVSQYTYGNGTITFGYSGGLSGSTIADVTWFNSAGPLMFMQANPETVVFNSTESASSLVTVTNLSGVNLNGLIVNNPTTVNGSGVATIRDNNCDGASLSIGQSCTYVVSITDSITEANRQVRTSVQANYSDNGVSQVYNDSLDINYTSNSFRALVFISPNPANISVIGNYTDITNQILTISNNGAAKANIESQTLSANPLYLSVTNGSSVCGSTLNVGESCSVVLNLGPITSGVTESGTALYTVRYHGGQTLAGVTATDNINYVVQPNSQALSVSDVAVQGNSSGSGVLGTPYIFSGANTGTKSVSFTVQNTGTNSVTISGIQDSNSIYAWRLESAGVSTCYAASLEAGATCSLVYTNILAVNAIGLAGVGGIGASYTENISTPMIYFYDTVATPLQFQIQPNLSSPYSGTTLYATAQQATIANSVTIYNTNTPQESAVVQTILANASGYASLTMTATMEDYFTTVQSASNCTTNSANSIMTQTCSLNPGGGSSVIGTVIYAVDPWYAVESLSINSLFSVNPAGQTVSMSPLAITTPLY